MAGLEWLIMARLHTPTVIPHTKISLKGMRRGILNIAVLLESGSGLAPCAPGNDDFSSMEIVVRN